MEERFDSEPIRAELLKKHKNSHLSWDAFFKRYNLDPKMVRRALSFRTIDVWTADELSIRIGLHPAILWPEYLIPSEGESELHPH